MEQITEPTFFSTHWKRLTKKITRIYIIALNSNNWNRDGKKNAIINGITDWFMKKIWICKRIWLDKTAKNSLYSFDETPGSWIYNVGFGKICIQKQETFQYQKQAKRDSLVSLRLAQMFKITKNVDLNQYNDFLY
jgi:hypothetical protein